MNLLAQFQQIFGETERGLPKLRGLEMMVN